MKCEFLEKSNVIADHTLNLSMKQLKTQKMKKKCIPLFTVSESHQKLLVSFIWPLEKKWSLGEIKVIEMTPL